MKYLSDGENTTNLEAQMDPNERAELKAMKSTRIEAAFLNRLLIVFKLKNNQPEIISTIKVTDFWISLTDGSVAVLENLETGEEIEIDHIPSRLFDFPIYMSIPPVAKVRWDARLDDDSVVRRSLVFPILISARSRSDRPVDGDIYAETPKRFIERFPGHSLPLRHI